jgi:putative ABC transport system substrate-binding protein
MRRRKFLGLVGGAAAWPVVARSQAAMPVIGFLGAGTMSSHGQWAAAFSQRLRDVGWIDGRTVAVQFQWAGGSRERATEIAAEFVRLKVDIIVASGTAFIIAAKQATSTIPIVFAAAGDPVGTGLVTSLARPGGNATGLSIQATDVAAKRLELLREVVPSLDRLAIIGNVGSPIAVLEMREVETTARTLGLDVKFAGIRRPEDIEPAFETLKDQAGALYVANDPLIDANRIQIITLALVGRLATMYGNSEHVAAGGLMSYGPNFPDLFRRAAEYVDKILRGAKPADLPVEQPTKFDLVFNQTTAKALGIIVPPKLLFTAEQVIE